MAPVAEAEENLRVIRTLMERATVYRAISIPAAVIGGVLACVAGLLVAGRNDFFIESMRHGPNAFSADLFGFQVKWLIVLLLSAGANLYFLYRHSSQRGALFVSPGMKMALQAMFPAFLAAVVFSSISAQDGLPKIWMLFYGLALLSTSHFAPRSLVRLGWCFVLSGLFTLLVDVRAFFSIPSHVAIPMPGKSPALNAWNFADAMMAVTFGGYHLIYALCTGLKRKPLAKETPAL